MATPQSTSTNKSPKPASTRRQQVDNKQSATGSFFSILANISLPSARATLLTGVGCLMIISLLMVASASIPFALKKGMPELHYFQRQFIYMVVGMFAAFVVSKIPLKFMYNLMVQFFFLTVTVLLLILTLLIGDEINGSKRWLEFGFFNFQVAELAKFVLILFTGGFLVRRSSEVRRNLDGFARIFMIVALFAFLLLFQPDFGSVVIIGGCILAMFYAAGAPMIQFVSLFSLLSIMATAAVVLSDYRLARVLSFTDPFNDMQGSDYQLSRSLIAFGRGEWFGVGYGESVQKLSHLPEAHTDFLLAITGEELGLLGVVTVILLELLVVASAMRISYSALKRQQMRISYTAFAWDCCQPRV